MDSSETAEPNAQGHLSGVSTVVVCCRRPEMNPQAVSLDGAQQSRLGWEWRSEGDWMMGLAVTWRCEDRGGS